MVVFGDSLSDTGTYAHAAKKANSNGRFTTTGDKVWTELLAEKLNLSAEPNRLDGFGIPVQKLGGLNYAQGGSRVTEKDGPGKDKGYSMRPMTEQVQYFLDDYKKFDRNDLVLVGIGGNDILVIATALMKGEIKSLQEGVKAIRKQVQNLASILNKIEKNGNPYIAVLSFPDLSESPKALKNEKLAQIYEALVDGFNNELKDKVKDPSWISLGVGGDAIHHNIKTTLIPIYKLDRKIVNREDHCGFTNVTEPACDIENIPGKSALFCGASKINSGSVFKFADDIHPSAKSHEIISDYSLNHLKNIWGQATTAN